MNANQAATPPVPVPRGATPEGDGIVVGTGPVDVEAYIDFQCPFCKQFELMTGPRAVARGVAGTPSVFVRGIPVPARPGPILAAVERVLI